MAPASRDHNYTLSLAQAAIQWIRENGLPADPPSFELWYVYFTRLVPQLNRDVDDILARNGTITAADSDALYAQHLVSSPDRDRVGVIGENVNGEMSRIAAILDGAVVAAQRCDHTLIDLDAWISRADDRTSLKAVIDRLSTTTRAVIEENRAHRTALEAARGSIAQMHDDLAAMQIESRTDPLTSLANRKHFDWALDAAIARAATARQPLSLLMCDVDHFKSFNDTWGHAVGDDVLRLIAREIRHITRASDVAARYGGEEFAIICTDTALAEGATVAERLRASVFRRDIVQRSTGIVLGKVTVSVGLAELRAGDTARELIERADACLYAAKRLGRNRVIKHDPDDTAGSRHDPARNDPG
ncbi:GGDEF domain-containing protein [Blastochloris tepida]|uniref:diguanylate cyclase n=1 Tax=Blastochloris tepida TaxID=2233851 RepID=A0A348FXC8_9HYPH|nr:GGDEF domain-containing protein [Blastochloris tepida]BBF91961.1 GGDEF domain-containing protein [Blastochloris tepida]